MNEELTNRLLAAMIDLTAAIHADLDDRRHARLIEEVRRSGGSIGMAGGGGVETLSD